MEVAAHSVPNSLKAGKIETIQRSQPQLPQAAVEMSVQYPAGSPADQGNIATTKRTKVVLRLSLMEAIRFS